MTAPAPADARVLVVDDEPYIADLLSTGLRFVGLRRPHGRQSGSRRSRSVREWKPDLLVLDVMMPDVDGFEVTRRLRADGRETPVLFLTARDAVEDKVAGLTIGGDDYVTKPFSLEEIVARVRALLRRQRQYRAGRRTPAALRRRRARRGRARGHAARAVPST